MKAYIQSLEALSKQQLMLMLARKRLEERQGIAVVGMGCRFPGGIDHPKHLWEVLRSGQALPGAPQVPTDSLGRARWNLEAPDLAPLADSLRKGTYLDGVDLFDAGYFGLSDEEALYLDPQQRLLLMVAVEALSDANLTGAQLRQRRVGVFCGVSPVEYLFAALRNGITAEELSPYMGTGSALSAAAARIAVSLQLNGPVITVDTASSSGLTAVHLACAALRRQECDLAIVGACHLILSPLTTGVFAQAGMLSSSGLCRPFTAEADGAVRGEGCGVLVLKRAQDAQADKDRSYGLIRGSAVYQHGDRPGMSVTPGIAQRRLIEQALESAELRPDEVQYVEAHANGSKLGGVIEVESLADAYGRRSPSAQPLYVGSCKANLGYLETASSIASLMKVLLALEHGEIPPQAHFNNPDPAIPWEQLAIRVPREAVPWPAAERRIAGVSALGFTGTNAHVLVEAAPRASRPAPPQSAGPDLLVVSAHSAEALKRSARRLHDHLLHAREEWTINEACMTLALGRDLQAVRHAAVVRGKEELLAQLLQVAEGQSTRAPPPPAAFTALSWEHPTESQLQTVLRQYGEPEWSGLRRRILQHARVLGLGSGGEISWAATSSIAPAQHDTWAFALALAWLEMLQESGVSLSSVTLEGPSRHLLAEVAAGICTAEQACTRWRAGERPPEAGPTSLGRWRAALSSKDWALMLPGAPKGEPLRALELGAEAWLAFVVDQVVRGARLQLAALWPPRTEPLLRLPPNAFVGQHYWPENNLWS
jgi:acyl transferase domain-containing protein